MTSSSASNEAENDVRAEETNTHLRGGEQPAKLVRTVPLGHPPGVSRATVLRGSAVRRSPGVTKSATTSANPAQPEVFAPCGPEGAADRKNASLNAAAALKRSASPTSSTGDATAAGSSHDATSGSSGLSLMANAAIIGRMSASAIAANTSGFAAGFGFATGPLSIASAG